MRLWSRIATVAAGIAARWRDFIADVDRDSVKDTRVVGVLVADGPVFSVDLRHARVYRVGSDPACEIRLPSGPPIAAELAVNPPLDGLTFTPFWPDGRGTALRDGDAQTLLDVGNSVVVGGARLEIVDPHASALTDAPVRSRWAGRIRRLLTWILPASQWPARQRRAFGVDLGRVIGGGFAERDVLLRKLGAVVDEPEAALAEMQFATGRRVFLSCTIAFALVCSAVIASVPIFGPSASGAGAAVLLLAALVFSLATSAYAAPGASVYVGMAGVVVGSLVPGIEGGGQFGASLFAFLFGSLGAYVGYRLEMAWFPVPNPVRQQHAGDAWALLLFATVIPAPYEMSRLELVTRAVIAALVVGWATLGLPYSRRRFLTASYSVDRDSTVTHRRRLHATPDSLMLLEAAWLFWRRQLSFRIVGILLAIPPLVGLMNSCAVAPRLTQHRTEISRDLLLVWSDPTGSEPTPERVYALPQDWWTRRRVSVASSSLPGHRIALARDTDAYRALDEYGVTIPAGLRDVADASGGSSPELWCEEKDKRESGAPPGPALVSRCYVARGAAGWLDQLLAVQMALRPAAAVLTGFGLLIMWRAPGERGSVATAIWAFGYASALGFAVPLVESGSFTSLDTLVMQWGFAPQSESTIVRFAYVVLRGLMTLGTVLGLMAVLGFLSTAVAVAWLWPPPRSADGRWVLHGLALRAAFIVAAPVGAFAAVVSAVSALDAPIGAVLEALFIVLVALIPFAIPFALAGSLRLPGTIQKPQAVAFALPSALAAIVLFAMSRPNALAWLVAAAAILTAALVWCLAYLLFWRKLWKLAGGRTLAAAVTVVALPLAEAVIENVGQTLVTELALFPGEAMELVALMITLALAPPLYQGVRMVFERLTVSQQVRRAAAGIPALIERLISAPVGSTEALGELLEQQMGVRRYAFFGRTGPRTFVPSLVAPAVEVPAELSLTPELLRRLGQAPDFIDLQLTVYDPNFVTAAPELWRLDRQLRRQLRYLLPVTIGGVPCALLLVGEDPLPDDLRAESVLEHIRAIGAAITRFVRR